MNSGPRFLLEATESTGDGTPKVQTLIVEPAQPTTTESTESLETPYKKEVLISIKDTITKILSEDAKLTEGTDYIFEIITGKKISFNLLPPNNNVEIEEMKVGSGENLIKYFQRNFTEKSIKPFFEMVVARHPTKNMLILHIKIEYQKRKKGEE